MKVLNTEWVSLENLEFISKSIGIQFTISEGKVLCSDEDYDALEIVGRLYKGESL